MVSRPVAIVVAGIAVAAAITGAAWLLLHDDGLELASRRDPRPKYVDERMAALGDAVRSAETPHEEPALPRALVEVSRDAEAGNEAAGARPLDHGPADGWPVLVVERATDRPIAGATLAVLGNWFDSVDFDQVLAWPLDQAIEGRFLAITDEDGIARVPAIANELIVFAVARGLRGVGYMSVGSPRPVKLAIGPPRQLRVRAVDRTGRPRADLPVRFGRFEGDSDWDGYGRRAFTNHDGLATIDGVDLVPPANDETSFGVRVLMFGPDRLFVPLDVAHLPESPVEIVVPEYGIVAARIVDERGETLRCGGRANLAALDPRPDIQSAFLDDVALVDGVARWLPVAFLPRIRVDARLDGADPVSIESSGPSRDGETVELRLPYSLVKPWIVGRVLLPDGRPLVSAPLLLRLIRETASGEVDDTNDRSIETAPDGGIRIDGRGLLETGRGSLALQPRPRPDATHESLGARVELRDVRDRAVIDVGDVRLVARPVIVAGDVVDDAGAPVTNAELHVDLGGDVPAAELATFDLVELRSDAAGRFAVFGSAARRRAEVRAQKEDLLVGRPAVFTIGATDVRVVLSRPGGLEGSARIEEGIPPDLLVMELRPRDLPLAPKMEPVETRLDGDGVFEFVGLWPGRYDATLRVQGKSGVAEELLTIPGVVVRAHEKCVDPRLQQIDVVGRTRAIRVRVAGSDGEPVDAVLVRAFLSASSRAPVVTTGLNDGVATFLTLGASLDVEAWAPGFRLERLAGVREDVEVRLRRGIARTVRLHVELPPAAEQLQSPVRARLSLEGMAPFPDADWMEAELDAQGNATFELSDPGRWFTSFRLDVPYRNWMSFQGFGSEPIDLLPTFFHVDDASEPIDLTVVIPAHKLIEAEERQRGRNR